MFHIPHRVLDAQRCTGHRSSSQGAHGQKCGCEAVRGVVKEPAGLDMNNDHVALLASPYQGHKVIFHFPASPSPSWNLEVSIFLSHPPRARLQFQKGL